MTQFQAIFEHNNIDILTGREADEWLTEEIVYLPYGKKDVKTENKFNLSAVYKFTSRGSDHQLALQYHMYMIFREVSAKDDDKKTLDDICDQLEVALGLDDLDSETESSSEAGDTDVLGGMDLGSIGEQAGGIVSSLLGSLGDLGLDMPEGSSMPPADEIQRVINSVTSNPKSREAINKIVSNVQRGTSIEGVIQDPEVQSLLKNTLQETAKMASESGHSRSRHKEVIPELIPADTEGPSDFDPASQT